MNSLYLITFPFQVKRVPVKLRETPQVKKYNKALKKAKGKTIAEYHKVFKRKIIYYPREMKEE